MSFSTDLMRIFWKISFFILNSHMSSWAMMLEERMSLLDVRPTDSCEEKQAKIEIVGGRTFEPRVVEQRGEKDIGFIDGLLMVLLLDKIGVCEVLAVVEGDDAELEKRSWVLMSSDL